MKRLVLMMLVLCMALTILPVNVQAVVKDEASEFVSSIRPNDEAIAAGEGIYCAFLQDEEENIIFLEPIFADDPGGIQTFANKDLSAFPLFTSIDEAAKYYKTSVMNRSEFGMKIDLGEYPEYIAGEWQPYAREIFKRVRAKAEEYNGVPDEGDYLRHIGDYHLSIFYANRNSKLVINRVVIYIDFDDNGTAKAPYYSTAEQEAQVGPAVDKLINQLGLNGMISDFEKIQAVYEWMVTNIRYDNDHIHGETCLTPHSAYAAIIDKTAVCTGYALLFYRIMLTIGIDCRFINGYAVAGDASSGHSWNIVKLEGKWYLIDATWDASRYFRYLDNGKAWTNRNWFLRGSNSEHFAGREWDERFMTAEFQATYPLAICDYNAHTPKTVGAKEADCTHNGYTGDVVCYVCGDIIEQGSVIPALGHSYGDDDICDVCGFDRSLFELGDINADGKVDVQDGVLMQRILANLESNEEYKSRADLNGDGKVDVQDGVKMQRILANLE